MRTLLMVLALVSSGALAEEPGPLRVGVAGAEPFVTQGASPGGFAVETFQAVASELGLKAEYVAVPTVADAITQVHEGKLDLAVGPISVTADRVRRVAFTQPYFQAGLSVLSRPSSSVWDRVAPLFSKAFAVGVAILLLILAGVGTLMWLMERRANPAQFPPGARDGIGAGVWLALVTMTTVGYGDKAPITPRGRVVTGVWMLISMMFASSLTAGIAAALTLSQVDDAISTPKGLRGRRVATLAGSTSVDFAQRNGAIVITTATLAEAVKDLEDRAVDAVLFDRPMLSSYLREHPGTEAVLSEGEWEVRGYAFALKVGNPLTHELNVALLDLAHSGRLGPVRVQWLGE